MVSTGWSVGAAATLRPAGRGLGRAAARGLAGLRGVAGLGAAAVFVEERRARAAGFFAVPAPLRADWRPGLGATLGGVAPAGLPASGVASPSGGEGGEGGGVAMIDPLS
jgi:hypothetical protein